MDSPTTYFHWGFILISLPNLLVIVGMVLLFAVALVLPFPHGGTIVPPCGNGSTSATAKSSTMPTITSRFGREMRMNPQWKYVVGESMAPPRCEYLRSSLGRFCGIP